MTAIGSNLDLFKRPTRYSGLAPTALQRVKADGLKVANLAWPQLRRFSQITKLDHLRLAGTFSSSRKTGTLIPAYSITVAVKADHAVARVGEGHGFEASAVSLHTSLLPGGVIRAVAHNPDVPFSTLINRKSKPIIWVANSPKAQDHLDRACLLHHFASYLSTRKDARQDLPVVEIRAVLFSLRLPRPVLDAFVEFAKPRQIMTRNQFKSWVINSLLPTPGLPLDLKAAIRKMNHKPRQENLLFKLGELILPIYEEKSQKTILIAELKALFKALGFPKEVEMSLDGCVGPTRAMPAYTLYQWVMNTFIAPLVELLAPSAFYGIVPV